MAGVFHYLRHFDFPTLAEDDRRVKVTKGVGRRERGKKGREGEDGRANAIATALCSLHLALLSEEEEVRMHKGERKRKKEVKAVRRMQEHNVSVAKILLLFLSAFLFASAAFLMLWIYIGEAYQNIVFIVAKFILRAIGYSESQISAVNLSGAYLVNFNLVPLFALAAVTPRISLIKRAKILVFGFPLLFSLHVLDIIAHFPLHFYGSELAWFIVNSIGVASIAAPFVIWFIFVQEDLVTSSPH